MDLNELRLMQNYPLWMKVEKSKRRIQEWYENYEGQVYVSFSGGKDSTALLHLVRSIYPDVEAVFVNTGLEYPEVYKFVKTFDNVRILKPDMNFKEVINKYGYPVISKENSQYLYDIRTGTEYMKKRRLECDSQGRFKLPKKYHYLIDSPFKISHKCCSIMKKNPVKRYEKETNKKAILGTMAEESNLRQQSYLKHGCNAFENKRPVSTPLGFWRQNDILEYIYVNNLKIASVYGDIVIQGNLLGEHQYKTTGCDRTGCVYCLFGINQEQEPNRMQRLKETHPNLYDYCINKLGLKEVLDYMNIKY